MLVKNPPQMEVIKMTRLTIVCISFIVVSLMFYGLSYAKIDEESIMGMWLFDDDKGDTAKDSSGNGNDGVLTNDPEWVDGKFSKALSFGGVDDFVAVTNPIINTPDPFTAAGWVKLSTFVSTDRGNIIVGNYNGQWKGYYLNVKADGRPNLCVGRQGDQTVKEATSPDAITLNTWYHIVGIYDGTGPKVYVNGVLKNSQAYSPVEPEIANTRIGGGQWNAPRAQVTGLIDEVALFNVVLLESDIQAIMTKGIERATGMTAVSPSGKLATTWADIKQ
jgi:hypothetical protein